VIAALLIAAALGAPHQSVPAFAGCLPNDPQVRPTALLISCPDGKIFLGGLVWSRWGQTDALAQGVEATNECSPTCRFGRTRSHRVAVRLFRARTCSNGRREFTRLTVSGSVTFKSPFYSGNGCP
jgi:hypothetical protein